MPAPLNIAYKGQTYSLRQLADATGINASTLRSWLRRWGTLGSRIDKLLADRAELACLVRLASQHGISRTTWAKRVQRGKDPVDAATWPTRPRAKCSER